MLRKLFNPDRIFVFLMLFLCIGLFFMPTGFEKSEEGSVRAKGLILQVDDSLVQQRGLVKTGSQSLKVEIMNGSFKGQEVDATNRLLGRMEFDKLFKVGDKALVVVEYMGQNLTYVNVIDHYRVNIELLLFSIFILLLVILGGWTGAKAVLSFIFTILMIWKVLLPSFLKGYDPILVSLVIVTIITGVTCLLVANLSRKALVAFLGSFSGILLTCIIAIFFGGAFHIHGAIAPFSETLLYSGYPNLDITRIFLAGIFLASSGAIMDVAMDISASISEVVTKKPDISRREAVLSGFSVARPVVGTMTTTLLLAYSGGYISLLMVFIAQGTPPMNIFNLTYVAGEILHTLVGSFGLIMVAPFTAIVGGYLFTRPAYIQLLKGEEDPIKLSYK